MQHCFKGLSAEACERNGQDGVQRLVRCPVLIGQLHLDRSSVTLAVLTMLRTAVATAAISMTPGHLQA